jgi:hypothetical protein
MPHKPLVRAASNLTLISRSFNDAVGTGWIVNLTTFLHLVQRPRMRGDFPLGDQFALWPDVMAHHYLYLDNLNS